MPDLLEGERQHVGLQGARLLQAPGGSGLDRILAELGIPTRLHLPCQAQKGHHAQDRHGQVEGARPQHHELQGGL